MPDSDPLTHLQRVSDELAQRYRELPIAHHAYLVARGDHLRAHLQAGLSITQAREAADYDAYELLHQYEVLQGEIAALDLEYRTLTLLVS